RLPLLQQLFGEVLIPVQVADELDRGRHILGPWREAPGATCLIVSTPAETPFLRELESHLDEGEAAAIALAIDRGSTLLLMDEVDGRNAAVHHGLTITGTLGILLEAKRGGLIDLVRPMIDSLKRK